MEARIQMSSKDLTRLEVLKRVKNRDLIPRERNNFMNSVRILSKAKAWSKTPSSCKLGRVKAKTRR